MADVLRRQAGVGERGGDRATSALSGGFRRRDVVGVVADPGAGENGVGRATAHPDTGACTPARAPSIKPTLAAGPLGMMRGTVNGDTRRGPRLAITSCCSSMVVIPPMPLETTTARRSGSMSGADASAHASFAA